MISFHTSVLLQEAIDDLNVIPGEKYIDATLGGGGHARLIIERGGLVLGIDQDEEAIEYIKKEISNIKYPISNIQLVYGNFSEIGEIARKNGFENIAGILFDLGVSTHQLESTERGFSFLRDSSLDMRMDKKLSISAKDLINGLHKGELEELFRRYGEEQFAKRIAELIVDERSKNPVETTTRLAGIISRAYPKGINRKINPGTKVFQALRIAVNDELVSLEKALPQALDLLKNNGRIVIVSFHSLEDRIVKHSFLDWEKKDKGRIITKKPIVASEEEIIANPRSRSAKMRIFERRY